MFVQAAVNSLGTPQTGMDENRLLEAQTIIELRQWLPTTTTSTRTSTIESEKCPSNVNQIGEASAATATAS